MLTLPFQMQIKHKYATTCPYSVYISVAVLGIFTAVLVRNTAATYDPVKVAA